MDRAGIRAELARIARTAGAAVLATADRKGRPHVRWVTPGLLDTHPRSIFMVTSSGFSKVADVRGNERVEWLFQTPALDTIVTVRGTMAVLENAPLKSEVFEALAPRLRTFWSINLQRHETIVLETAINEAVYFRPMRGIRETVTFTEGGGHGRG